MLVWHFFFMLNSAVCLAQAEKKVNLGIGAYRDEAGKPWVLECVKAVSVNQCVHHELCSTFSDFCAKPTLGCRRESLSHGMRFLVNARMARCFLCCQYSTVRLAGMGVLPTSDYFCLPPRLRSNHDCLCWCDLSHRLRRSSWRISTLASRTRSTFQ